MTLTQNQNVVNFDYTDDFTPNSSVVAKVFYDEPNERLAVGIKHGPHIYFYVYNDVPRTEYNHFMWSNSVGRYYNSFIKGNYDRDLSVAPEAPWGFSKYAEPEQLVTPSPRDAVVPPKAKRVFELDLAVPSAVRIEADSLDEALSLLRTAPTDYVTLEVVGGKVVA